MNNLGSLLALHVGRTILLWCNGLSYTIDWNMNLSWILLGLVGWALGLVAMLALFRMSGDQDRAARHEEKRLDPYSDVTITRAGEA